MSTMFQGVEKDSAAFRLMQQMGWEEGTGLGKDKQGMKEHLRVRSKQDTAGIGIDHKMKAQTLWKVNTMEYDNVLKKLKVVVGQAVEGDEKEEDDKKTKAQNAMVETNQNDKEELRVIKATRPQGRYKSREKGKMVGAYSSTDLTAILGGVQTKTTETEKRPRTPQSDKVTLDSITNVRVQPCDQVAKDISSDILQQEDLAPASKKVRRAKTEPEFVGLPEDWWGNKFGFVRAGSLGATSGTLKTERKAFQEKDQEELAKLAAEKATKGKQGLGAADRIRMSKGSGWKGQKKSLELDSEEEAHDGEEENGEDRQKDAVLNTRYENNDEIVAETQTKDNVKDKTKSWKKVCKQLLREAPLQTLSLKRLEKRFLSTMLSAYGTEVQLDREKLQKSSRFVIEGKNVTLCSA